MRTKILFFIASLLILPLAVTSCLNSNDTNVTSSDDLITAFGLDTIYGKNYKFTIDQYGDADGTGLIYNVDSVPFSADTIINKILIKSFSTGGYPTSGETALKDTLFAVGDSIDFSNTMVNPLVIRIRSTDGLHMKTYKIEVRRHLSVPDSLVWNRAEAETESKRQPIPFSNSFSGGAVDAGMETKAILLGNKILVFTSEGTKKVFYTEPNNSIWTKITTDLPSDANLSSIISFRDILYTTAESGEIYQSADGETWSTVTSTITEATSTSKVTSLLTTFYGKDSSGNVIEELISGIIEEDDGRLFACASIAANGSLTWEKGKSVPVNFPTENICAIKSYAQSTGVQIALLVGKPTDSGATTTTPWFSTISDRGKYWAQMTSGEASSLPAMKRPSIIYYGKKLYAFGDDFSVIYKSRSEGENFDNGKTWEKIKKDFRFPIDINTGTPIFEGRSADYSVVIDSDNYLWMIWNKGTINGTAYSDQAWRGKLNKLSFLIQD